MGMPENSGAVAAVKSHANAGSDDVRHATYRANRTRSAEAIAECNTRRMRRRGGCTRRDGERSLAPARQGIVCPNGSATDLSSIPSAEEIHAPAAKL